MEAVTRKTGREPELHQTETERLRVKTFVQESKVRRVQKGTKVGDEICEV